MATMFVRHQVSDFARWKAAYDDFRPTQQRFDVLAEAVYRAPDNPNDVTVTHEFASVEAARAFGARDELRSTMETSGVIGQPSIWFGDKA